MAASAWTPVDDTASKWTPVKESAPDQPGWLDKEIPLTSHLAATESGIQSVAKGTRDAIKGTIQLLDPRAKNDEEQGVVNSSPYPGAGRVALPIYRILRSLGHTAEDSTQVIDAMHDINQSPDPVGTYAKVAQDTAGQGAGQAITALATEGLVRGLPKAAGVISDAANSDTAAALADKGASTVRAAARGANKVLAKAPGTLGGAAGAAIGYKLGGRMGAEIGGGAGVLAGKELLPQVRIPGEGFGLPDTVEGGPVNAPQYVAPTPTPEPPAVYPGAPLPETPDPALLQSQPLAQGGQAATSPSDALGQIPLAKLPTEAVKQAVNELGTQASKPSLTARANEIAIQLQKAMGTEPVQIKPGVTMRNQMKMAPTEAPPTDLPEGFTPVESTALKGYKYDPETREFESITQGGQHYVHGNVSPEEAAKFEAADSKGRAWQSVRNEGTLVAKVLNGKRVAVKPIVSPEDEISPEEWEAGQQMDTHVEGTPSGESNASKVTKTANAPASPDAAQPANGRSDASAAVYEPRQPELPTASGARTDLKVPGSADTHPAQYEVRDLKDVHPFETVGTEAGAARDTSALSKVKAEHPDWTLSKQLQEAAKRVNP